LRGTCICNTTMITHSYSPKNRKEKNMNYDIVHVFANTIMKSDQINYL